jgi:2-oxoacid:acceptor oxidoreductase gamma subunit (pyruvate/2-ketoisovalerate family)
MREIRLHGKGGQGVVKASQIVVQAAENCGLFGQFIPFFGVERKGSKVYGYLRVDRQEIRQKTQIYYPDIVLILDDSLLNMPETYAGLKQGGTVIINTAKDFERLSIPDNAGQVIAVDGSSISETQLGRNLPNTAMLGALAHALTLIDKEHLFNAIEQVFDVKNRQAAEIAYNSARVFNGEGVA